MAIDELQALFILASAPPLGPIKIRSLLKKFGNAVNVLQAPSKAILEIEGFNEAIVQQLKSWLEGNEWKEHWKLTLQEQITLIPFTDPRYPKALLEIADFPILLHVAGELKKQDYRSIAVIGTRQSSDYGNEMAEKISQDLTHLGYTVVSGLARGVDTAAHRGALKKGRTIAVLGSGLKDIYPYENQSLAENIQKRGAVISEFPAKTPPDRTHFPRRNRIVSGMTLATVLIEAPVKSGAIHTMERGHSQGKRLFALPGRANEENYRGNHMLIKNGKAKLVESAEQIAESLENLF